ncbi:hypothetical protein EYF80_003603 [Liparis tanakae]|uniref:Uncharacterized protein n=1 Tax=Liparis tanakae TaxID=230148 RepID=A0A4Z2J7L8_9TELE|nr:hypothetical protein EYF80_003603 [Liparis tanakae]
MEGWKERELYGHSPRNEISNDQSPLYIPRSSPIGRPGAAPSPADPRTSLPSSRGQARMSMEPSFSDPLVHLV